MFLERSINVKLANVMVTGAGVYGTRNHPIQYVQITSPIIKPGEMILDTIPRSLSFCLFAYVNDLIDDF